MIKVVLSLFLLCFLVTPSIAKTINLPSIQEDKLPNILMERVVKRLGYDFEYPDHNASAIPNLARQISKTQTGDYDVMWTLTAREFEEQLLPIRIPVYKGIFGYRLAMIKQGNENLLSNVHSLADLQEFKAGQGTLWADTAILEANGVPVVKEMKYFNLFPMLEGGRFDYFPRAANEPWSEIKREAKYNLTVDPHIVIKYIAPFYFFVNPDSPDLHRQIKNELLEMIEDGSFEKLFRNDPSVIEAMTKGNLRERRVIELTNPALHELTPLNDKSLWFDPLS